MTFSSEVEQQRYESYHTHMMSHNMSHNFSQIEWKEDAPLSKKQKESQIDESFQDEEMFE